MSKAKYRIGRGAECSVYVFGRWRVLKIYRTKKERDNAFKRQAQAHKKDFAPPVYTKVYGYVSHKVKTSPCLLSDADLRKLMRIVKKQGWGDFDICNRNCGVYKGKPVVIDFGDMSMEG